MFKPLNWLLFLFACHAMLLPSRAATFADSKMHTHSELRWNGKVLDWQLTIPWATVQAMGKAQQLFSVADRPLELAAAVQAILLGNLVVELDGELLAPEGMEVVAFEQGRPLVVRQRFTPRSINKLEITNLLAFEVNSEQVNYHQIADRRESTHYFLTHKGKASFQLQDTAQQARVDRIFNFSIVGGLLILVLLAWRLVKGRREQVQG